MNSTDNHAPTPRRFIDPQLLTVLDMLNERTELAHRDYISVDDMSKLFERLMMEPCVAELHLGKDNYHRVRTDLLGYVEGRFSKKPTSIVTVLGYVLTVDSVIYPRPSAKLSQGEEQLSYVIIQGATYAISPAVVDPSQVDPKMQHAIHISDFIDMTIEERRKAKDEMFRHFLIRQIYNYLVGKAFLGHTTTYENIANEFGLPNKGNQLGSTLSPLLSSIYEFCVKHHQPLLTVIVVRKSGELKDLPGNGFWALYNKHPVLAVETIADRREYTRSLQQQVFEYWAGLGQ